MAQSSAQISTRCTHSSFQERGPFSLPVLADHQPRGQIRKSKSSKRRAIVLATVQLLIIAHIVLWLLSKRYGWFGGKTSTPVEPSESMEFAKNGLINAGLIFFAIALLGTLIFGRWFCGWGCHIVMLQDLCSWIMKKCDVRPKAFRSRFLMYVPLILAIYMFIMPAVHRWGLIPLDRSLAGSLGPDNWLVQTWRGGFGSLGFPLPYAAPQWKVTAHLTTTDFWRTFAGVGVAIPFLLVCGFAVVYFLGSKGFCTYGCPYGGFFAPLDKLAVGRILVTDACEGCGHCTAVCTSNVRVHQEVREYGMVVDPGCMKCLDCVSVCPNDALYFGFAKPSLLKGAAKHEAPRKIYDFTLGEEFAFSLIFLLTFLSVRGVYGAVPMLMAAALAGILAFVLWKLWRMRHDASVTLYKFQLKFKGAITPTGWLYAAAAALAALLTVHSGIVNATVTAAKRHEIKAMIPPEQVFAENPPVIVPETLDEARRAVALYRRGSSFLQGGIGLPGRWQGEIDMNTARLLSVLRDFSGAEAVLRDAIERDGPSDHFCSSIAWMLFGQGRGPEAIDYAGQAARQNKDFRDTADALIQIAVRGGNARPAELLLRDLIVRDGDDDHYAASLMWMLNHQGRIGEALEYGDQILLQQKDFNATLDAYVNLAGALGDTQKINDLCRKRLEKFPDHLHTLRWLSVVLVQSEIFDEGIALVRRTLEIDPDSASGYCFLARSLADFGRMEDALTALRDGLKRMPDDLSMNKLLAEMLEFLNRADEAKPYRQRVTQLQAQQQQQQPNPQPSSSDY